LHEGIDGFRAKREDAPPPHRMATRLRTPSLESQARKRLVFTAEPIQEQHREARLPAAGRSRLVARELARPPRCQLQQRLSPGAASGENGVCELQPLSRRIPR
jgi:hypothetical protein